MSGSVNSRSRPQPQQQQQHNQQETQRVERLLDAMLSYLSDYMNKLLEFMVCQIERVAMARRSHRLHRRRQRRRHLTGTDTLASTPLAASSSASASFTNPHRLHMTTAKLVKIYRRKLSAEFEAKKNELCQALLYHHEHSYALNASEHIDIAKHVDFDTLDHYIKRLLDKFDTFFVDLADNNNNDNNDCSVGDNDDNDDDDDDDDDTEDDNQVTARYTDFASDTECYVAGKYTNAARLAAIRLSLRSHHPQQECKTRVTTTTPTTTTPTPASDEEERPPPHHRSESELDRMTLADYSPFDKYSIISVDDNRFLLNSVSSFPALNLNNHNQQQQQQQQSYLDDNDGNEYDCDMAGGGGGGGGVSVSPKSARSSTDCIVLNEEEDEDVGRGSGVDGVGSKASKTKRLKDLIARSRELNAARRGHRSPADETMLVGMRVLALRHARQHVWQMATLVDIKEANSSTSGNSSSMNNSTSCDASIGMYRKICELKYTVRFDIMSDDDDKDKHTAEDDDGDDKDDEENDKYIDDYEAQQRQWQTVQTSEDESIASKKRPELDDDEKKTDKADSEVICISSDDNDDDDSSCGSLSPVCDHKRRKVRPISPLSSSSSSSSSSSADSSRERRRRRITRDRTSPVELELDATCVAHLNLYEHALFSAEALDASDALLKSTQAEVEPHLQRQQQEQMQQHVFPIRSRVVTFYRMQLKRSDDSVLLERDCLMSGVVGELPSVRNLNRYMILLDNGACAYVATAFVYPLFDLFALPEHRLHTHHSRFVANYFAHYPTRFMVKLEAVRDVCLYLAGEWRMCRVLESDGSLATIRCDNVPIRLPNNNNNNHNNRNSKKTPSATTNNNTIMCSFDLCIYRGSFALQTLFNAMLNKICTSGDNSSNSNNNNHSKALSDYEKWAQRTWLRQRRVSCSTRAATHELLDSTAHMFAFASTLLPAFDELKYAEMTRTGAHLPQLAPPQQQQQQQQQQQLQLHDARSRKIEKNGFNNSTASSTSASKSTSSRQHQKTHVAKRTSDATMRTTGSSSSFASSSPSLLGQMGAGERDSALHGQMHQFSLESLLSSNNQIIKYVSHTCGNHCVARLERSLPKPTRRPQHQQQQQRQLSFVNPLLVPLLNGWLRQIALQLPTMSSVAKKWVNYMAPCGRVLRSISELDRYLFVTDSKLTIDMFSFDVKLYTNREFVANRSGQSCRLAIDDISMGGERVPISCVNCVDDSEPTRSSSPTRRPFVYSSKCIPMEGVPKSALQIPASDTSLDSDDDDDDDVDAYQPTSAGQNDDDQMKMSGCDCTDNCRDRSKCACWRKTFEATTFTSPNGEVNRLVGYRGRRLHDMVQTGIFECNSRCKCDCRCTNRVAQNGISLRLQLFRTSTGKGWGVRCLDDVTKGAFVCVYVGHLLTEEQSDQRGTEMGDEYFADLDFVMCAKRSRIMIMREAITADETSDDEALLGKSTPSNAVAIQQQQQRHQHHHRHQASSDDDDDYNSTPNGNSGGGGFHRRKTSHRSSIPKSPSTSSSSSSSMRSRHARKTGQPQSRRNASGSESSSSNNNNNNYNKSDAVETICLLSDSDEEGDNERTATPATTTAANDTNHHLDSPDDELHIEQVIGARGRPLDYESLSQQQQQLQHQQQHGDETRRLSADTRRFFKHLTELITRPEPSFVMDAKLTGNIGRFFNHSCSPNLIVQNVFVESNDPRFPLISLFAVQTIKAGTELCWDYNYDIGSVKGKQLMCHCQSVNCRGRLI